MASAPAARQSELVEVPLRNFTTRILQYEAVLDKLNTLQRHQLFDPVSRYPGKIDEMVVPALSRGPTSNSPAPCNAVRSKHAQDSHHANLRQARPCAGQSRAPLLSMHQAPTPPESGVRDTGIAIDLRLPGAFGYRALKRPTKDRAGVATVLFNSGCPSD